MAVNPHLSSPFLRTPLTDLYYYFGSMDIQTTGSPLCRRFELRLYNCLEAYGMQKGVTLCKDIYDDLLECTSFKKQRQRVNMIQEKRKKLIKEGKGDWYPSPGPDMYYRLYI